MKLEKCLCGKPPKLKKRPLIQGGTVEYYFYECCDFMTFGTRLPEFCLEGWNSLMKRKKKI